MSGNSIGQSFRVTTFGESHGAGVGAIVDGCPPGLKLDVADLLPDIDRRKTGKSRFVSQRREPDDVQILSGLFNGVTTGTPIGLYIANTNQRSKDYDDIRDKFRPGHADFAYQLKYGIRDHRGGGRSSARETVMRVAAGAIAKKYLSTRCGVSIRGYLSQLGPIELDLVDADFVETNPFFCPDPQKLPELEALMTELAKDGNSIGAKVTVVAKNVPGGLGEPIFDRLDADIAHALMSISAVKGVEIGTGFRSIAQRGTEHRDEIAGHGFLSNNAGGILGGISTGQDIVASIALKPTSSIRAPAKTITTDMNETEIVTHGRHDPCVGIRATPIAEAMMAITILDHLLRDRAQNFERRIVEEPREGRASNEG